MGAKETEMEKMIVLAPIEQPRRKTYWLKIGRASRNRDGSINVYLDALPVGTKLQLRDAEEERTNAGGNGAGGREEDFDPSLSENGEV